MMFSRLGAFLVFSLVVNLASADSSVISLGDPCDKAADPLMTVTSAWPEIYQAAADLPAGCFDGAWAEGISDTIVRKMGDDWSGFLRMLVAHPHNEKFFSLVLDSINATLDEEDIQAINKLAATSCPLELSQRCAAITKRAKEALADYDPPISPTSP